MSGQRSAAHAGLPDASHSVWADVRCSDLVVEAGKTLYVQGDPATSVMFVDDGAVQLRVLSRAGKQAVLAVLEAGSFFGEGALAGQALRMASAISVRPSRIRIVDTQEMAHGLHSRPEFAEYFLKYLLERSTRSEEDLAELKLHSTEQRLARTLLLLARVDQRGHQHRVIPKMTQGTLVQMVGEALARQRFLEQVSQAGPHRIRQRHKGKPRPLRRRRSQ